LQVKQKTFVLNYEYEYKRLFRFLNASFDTNSERERKAKSFIKTARLSEVRKSWFRQIISEKENKREEILVGKVFKVDLIHRPLIPILN
jgi:hypothetical protein